MPDADPGADAVQEELTVLRARLAHYEAAGAPRVASVRRVRVAALTVLAVVVLIGADWSARVFEMLSLVAPIEQIQGLERSGLEALVPDLKQMRSSASSQDQEQGRIAAGSKAQSLLEQLAPLADQVRDVHVAPWHGSARRARSRYLDNYDAMHRLLKDIADDPRKPLSTSDVGTTWASAKPALLAAVPPWSGRLGKRVQDLPG